MKYKEQKLTDQEKQELISLQEHPGWPVFMAHIDKLAARANQVTAIPSQGADIEILLKVRIAQATVSVYNGLKGFMAEIKAKAKSEEAKDG